MHQIAVAGLLAAFTIGLKILPYKRLARWMPSTAATPAEPWRKRRLLAHMRRAARYTPGATCLPQAMAGYMMLALQGREGRIRIGVARGRDGVFQAHATLVCGVDVVIGGGADYDGFTVLTELRPGPCAR